MILPGGLPDVKRYFRENELTIRRPLRICDLGIPAAMVAPTIMGRARGPGRGGFGARPYRTGLAVPYRGSEVSRRPAAFMPRECPEGRGELLSSSVDFRRIVLYNAGVRSWPVSHHCRRDRLP